jgi:TRAP-type transport system small permease protein
VFRRFEFACAALLLGAVVVLVGLAAVTRAMGTPIIWSVEIAQLLFLWLCILAIDLALQEERHFGLRIVQDNVSPRLGRIVEMINLLIIVALLAFLIRYAWRNTILMHTRLDGALQIRGSYLHASMVVGFALMIRTLLARLTLLARKLS